MVLSDHGQSLGATFRQVEGADLAEVCRALVSVPDVESVEAASGEAWGPVNTLLTSIFRAGPAQPPVVVGPDRERGGHRRRRAAGARRRRVGEPRPAVFPRRSGRVTLEEMLDQWPRLIPGLVARPSVGVVVGLSEGRGPVAVGAAGVLLLRDASVEGEDPLAQYGPRARADLLRAASLDNAGDLLIVSSVDDTGQVHAFEELVGSHGGLGGGQNDAVLLPQSSTSTRRCWTTSTATCASSGRGRAPPARGLDAAARGAPMSLTITWLGHSTVVIDLDGVALVSGPLLARHAGILRRRGDTPERVAWRGATPCCSPTCTTTTHLASLRRLPGIPVITAPACAKWLSGKGIDDGAGLADGQWLVGGDDGR